MVPVVSVVGRSNVGKTTYLEKLVGEIKRRGWRVATVKHDVHGFNLDQPGKDTYRLAEAGSDLVVLSGPAQVALMKRVDSEQKPMDIARWIGSEVDIVLTEGYKRENAPKIEVHRKGHSDTLLCAANELVAVATDEPLAVDAPQFPLDDPRGMVDLLEERFLGIGEDSVELTVNGRSVSIKPFVADVIANAVVGMVAALRDTENASRIELRILKRSGGKSDL